MTNKIRNSMVMKIKLFASAKKIAGGKDEVTLEFQLFSGKTVH
jgi:hypothetical protein